MPVPTDGLTQSDHTGLDQVVDIDVVTPLEQVISNAPHEVGVA
ncbi:MAG: hypothetical protein WA446_18935 [Steroidobacteraceae bacterium]